MASTTKPKPPKSNPNPDESTTNQSLNDAIPIKQQQLADNNLEETAVRSPITPCTTTPHSITTKSTILSKKGQ